MSGVAVPGSHRAAPPDRAASLRSMREPALPGIGTALRSATVELWFHPWPSLVANLLWTAAVAALVVLALVWPFAGLVLAPLLAMPMAGLYRVAARIVRGTSVSIEDGPAAWRSHSRRALAVGLGVVLALLVLGADLAIGLVTVGGPLGWALATGAFWALVAGWVLLLHLWPLLLDPHADRGLRASLRLATAVVLTFPGRAIRLAVVSAIALLLATVLFAVLATFAVAWLAILGCVVVLPAADRITGDVPRRGDEGRSASPAAARSGR